MPYYFLKGWLRMNKVLITGATGFIGSHITQYFCDNQIEVGCLIRENSSLANIQGLKVELETGNIQNLPELVQVFEGYEWVIHNAAKAADWGTYEEFYNTNVSGTRNVLQACLNSGIKNIIMTGSNSVYGEEDNPIVKDENSPYHSHYPYFGDSIFPCRLNYYRDTKALAKTEALKFAQRNGLNLTILDPVWVYGEREFNTGFYEYLKTAKGGIPFLPGSDKNYFHVIYAGDLARAFFLAYQQRLEGVHSIIIGNQKAVKMAGIYDLFCKEAGIKKPANMPKALVYPAAFMMELLYTVLNTKNPPLLTRGRVNMFYDNIEYSVQRAEQLLGFKNQYTLEEGIRKTVAWYKKHHLI